MASTMRVMVMTLMGFTTTQGAKVLRASHAGFLSAFSTRSSSFSHSARSFRQRAAPVIMAECEKKYTVVLVRHGESTWNEENKFTGWFDCPLSVKGVEEAKNAGKLLKSANFEFDVAHTSVLKRAIKTLWLALEELDQMYIPQKKSWRLNERHYGALQGLNKKETVAKHGKEQVNIWRRSYDVPPPPLDTSSEFYPGNDPRYKDVDKSLLPLTESLKITEERFMPCWVDQIAPDIKCGKRVIIAAHGNTLRALVKHLDNISEEEICELNIPTGIPLVYDLDENLKPIPHKDAIAPLTGYYLGDREEVMARIQGVAAQTGGK